MNYHLTEKSGNTKIGFMPVSTSSNKTCPSACPFKYKGCYARFGPLKMHWDKVSNGERGSSWNSFLSQVKNLPKSILWRHNQAGDIPGNGNTINFNMVKGLVKANKNKRGYTYTHKPVIGQYSYIKDNIKAIKYANKNGFTINLSANNLTEADKLYKKNIGPVVVVLPIDSPKHQKTPKGISVLTCPAQTDNLTCSQCGLCQNKDRNFIIGFRAHGAGKNSVNTISEVK